MRVDGRKVPRRKVVPAPLDYTRDLWLQQPGESKTAYEQFKAYREADPRRVRDQPSGFHNSVRWSWQERVKAWDNHLAEQEAERLIRYRVDMNERHRTVGRLAMGRAAQWLQTLTQDKIERMRPGEVVRMLEVAAKLERDASRGDLPDVTVGLTANVVDMTAKATDARLDELIREVARRREAVSTEGGGVVDVVEVQTSGRSAPALEAASAASAVGTVGEEVEQGEAEDAVE